MLGEEELGPSPLTTPSALETAATAEEEEEDDDDSVLDVVVSIAVVTPFAVVVDLGRTRIIGEV